MKTLAVCRGCGTTKLVNRLRLCKRCNRESWRHVSRADIEKERLMREAELQLQKELKEQAAAEKAEAEAAEAEEKGEEEGVPEEGAPEEGAPKEEAEEKYQEAVASGKNAGLVASKGENVFDYKVAFTPGEVLTAKLRFEQVLLKQNGWYTYELLLGQGTSFHSLLNEFRLGSHDSFHQSILAHSLSRSNLNQALAFLSLGMNFLRGKP